MKATRTATEDKMGEDNNKKGDRNANMGNNRRGGIDGYVMKEKGDNNFNNTKFKYMYILSFFRIIDINYVLE